MSSVLIERGSTVYYTVHSLSAGAGSERERPAREGATTDPGTRANAEREAAVRGAAEEDEVMVMSSLLQTTPRL